MIVPLFKASEKSFAGNGLGEVALIACSQTCCLYYPWVYFKAPAEQIILNELVNLETTNGSPAAS
jgi:hypothetical protein